MTSTPKKPRKSSTVVAKTPRKRASKPALPPNPFVHEILEYVGKQKSKVAKVEALKEHLLLALEKQLSHQNSI